MQSNAILSAAIAFPIYYYQVRKNPWMKRVSAQASAQASALAEGMTEPGPRSAFILGHCSMFIADDSAANANAQNPHDDGFG